jgi:hypothetical protein
METNHENPDVEVEKEHPETGRRKALMKIGKYGAYVAPAVLAIVLGNRAEAFCSLC